jgi:hypothetical protein
MTEEIKIKLTTDLDSKGLDDLRKKLNDSRNEVNAMARATDKGSKEWKQYKEITKELNRIIKLSDQDLRKYTNSIIAEEQALKKSSKATDSLKKETKSLKDMLVITAGDIGNVVRTLVDFGIKAINVGAEFGVLKDSFAGTASELALFRTATAGTVSDGSLIKLSNYASDLGVNMEDQAKLFSLAEDAADKYGGTVEDNFERVINASDGSSRGLRAVGVSVSDFNQELERLVKTTGVHLDSMSAEEQQNVRLQAIFNLTGSSLESVKNKTQDAKDKMDSLVISGENAVTAFGSNLVDAFVGTIKSMDNVEGSAHSLESVMGDLGTSIGNISANIANAAQDSIYWIGKALDKYLEWTGNADVPRMIDGKVVTKEKFDKEKADRERVEAGEERSAQRDRDKKQKEDANKPTQKPNSSNSGSNGKKDEVKLTNDLIDAQKKYNDLLAKEVTFTEDQKNQRVYLDYKKQLLEIEREIARLQSITVIYSTDGVKVAERFLGHFSKEDIKQAEYNAESQSLLNKANSKEDTSSTYEDVTNTYGAINNMMSVLNLGTETFVSKLLGGFNSVLIIMESIKAVNSILSFIPGFASGGSFSGGPMIVGERGPELLFANTSGYVMNNQDSQRYLNSSVNNSQPAINLYVGANLSPKYFTAQLEKANSRKNYRKV